MKRLIFITVLILIFFTSCEKKEVYHKITYEIEFYSNTLGGYSNDIEIKASPSTSGNFYEQVVPQVDRFNLPKQWKYEFYGLKYGDDVYFSVLAQSGYWFKMKLYIDDIETSSVYIEQGTGGYYGVLKKEDKGRNDYNGSLAIIKFKYQ